MDTFTPQSQQRIYTVTDISVFIRKVYGWMAVGLITSALAAWATVATPALLSIVLGNSIFFFAIIIIELILVASISGLVRRASAQTIANLFIIYAILNGITLSIVLLAFTTASIVSTFVVTAGMFGAMSLYGYTTKRDLTSWGSLLFMGLIGIILASVVNIFLQSNSLQFVVSILGVIIFVGLTAYDTQKIKEMGSYVQGDTDEGQKMALRGALALYLDFINLFLHLLRFFGHRRD